MSLETQPPRHTPLPVERLARKTAIACRQVVQNCLREEEWRDADQEFFEIIQQAFKELIHGHTSPER